MLLLGKGLQRLAGQDLQLKGARGEGDEKHQEESQQRGNSEFYPLSGFARHFSMITCSLSGYVICSLSRAMVSILWGDFSVASSTFSFACSSVICSRLLSSRAIWYSNSVMDMAPYVEEGHRHQDGGDEDPGRISDAAGRILLRANRLFENLYGLHDPILSATLSFALLARGLSWTSASPGTTGFRVRTFIVGFRPQAQRGKSEGQMQPFSSA